jgi:PPK2 family polyphosphate:nucleotide phosphotransferase
MANDQLHRLMPGKRVRMNDLPTQADTFHSDREAAEQEFAKLREEFIELQFDLYAEGERKLLVVFQAMDAGGKDGAIRHVFKGVNPQGVQVTAFKSPSAEERARDFLWRIHKAVPAAGMIGVFNRSQYEDVLIVRVDQLVPDKVWKQRFDQINDFERYLTATGTTILKFYLHISPAEQKRRFQERLDDPKRQWKFSVEDLEKRAKWNEYMAAFDDVLERCTTEWAPWYVIPADQKWYRNLAIVRVLVDTLRNMKLKLPSPPENLAQLRID